MTTITQDTIRKVLNQARPDELASALQRLGFGQMMERVEHDTGVITASATLEVDELLGSDGAPVAPGGALVMQSVRVTAVGTAATGVRTVSDSGSTPSATVVRLSADGKTLTFEGTITRATLVFTRAPAVSLDSLFAPVPAQ